MQFLPFLCIMSTFELHTLCKEFPSFIYRFFNKHIWRQWDDEDEDDDFDYFVRCVEPRLRL